MSRRIVGWLVPTAVLGLALLAFPVHAQAADGSVRYSFASVGLIPGQSVRVTIVNLADPPEPEAPPDPAIDPCWRVFLVDAEGRVVADSGDIELPPGRTRTFTVDYLRLGRAGNARTGRIQVRAVVEVENDNDLTDPPEPIKLRPTVEVINSATGRTTFGLTNPPDPVRVSLT